MDLCDWYSFFEVGKLYWIPICVIDIQRGKHFWWKEYPLWKRLPIIIELLTVRNSLVAHLHVAKPLRSVITSDFFFPISNDRKRLRSIDLFRGKNQLKKSFASCEANIYKMGILLNFYELVYKLEYWISTIELRTKVAKWPGSSWLLCRPNHYQLELNH